MEGKEAGKTYEAKCDGVALSEQLRERQEMEKKLQKLAKTMDYLKRAKREEAAPLVEAAYQQRLVEEKLLHEHEQQQDIELSKQHHDTEKKEKERLARIKHNKEIFQERVVSRREEEYSRLRGEREDQISQILHSRRQEREKMRKLKFYLSLEEERLRKLHEEEARKREEAERQRKEEAERKAKLDEIAAKQRQREQELEEKERQRKEALLRRSTGGPLKPSEPPTVARPTELVSAARAVAAAAPHLENMSQGSSGRELRAMGRLHLQNQIGGMAADRMTDYPKLMISGVEMTAYPLVGPHLVGVGQFKVYFDMVIIQDPPSWI